ncbi:MAG: hypothetical protein VX222_09240, partial [Actinomycetota bacterium]|nr:hypothetical protein [Actinomycetota bacterium]
TDVTNLDLRKLGFDHRPGLRDMGQSQHFCVQVLIVSYSASSIDKSHARFTVSRPGTSTTKWGGAERLRPIKSMLFR